MSQQDDPILAIAHKVADTFTYSGYAYVEEEHLNGLAAALRSFLNSAGIPVNPDAACLRDGRTDR
jgi:hypothetical protein